MPPSEGAASGLEARLQALLGRIARDPSRPTLDELAAIDEFHTRGREATAELLARLDPPPGSLVLDAGCGLGGPARLLAAERGCIVVGVDLDPGNVALARRLTLATGLGDRVRLAVADVTALPFPGRASTTRSRSTFAMSVADKPALYRELRRVLRRGGRLALHDLAAGPGGTPLLPGTLGVGRGRIAPRGDRGDPGLSGRGGLRPARQGRRRRGGGGPGPVACSNAWSGTARHHRSSGCCSRSGLARSRAIWRAT
jgi:SAM-dependent methyltransferase